MNRVNDLYTMLERGLAVFKEKKGDNHEYLYATRNLDYIRSLVGDAEYASIIDIFESNMITGMASDALQGFPVFDITAMKPIHFMPHYFTGACEAVAFTTAPDYANYPELMIKLGEQSRRKRSTDTEDFSVEVAMLSTYAQRYQNKEVTLNEISDLEIEISDVKNNIFDVLSLNSIIINTKNADNSPVESFYAQTEGNGLVAFDIPFAGVLALLDGSALSINTMDGRNIQICFYVNEEKLTAVETELNEQSIVTQEEAMNHLSGHRATEGDAFAEITELLDIESIVVAERKGFINTDIANGATFTTEYQGAQSKPALALMIRSPEGEYDWEFYLTKQTNTLIAA